MASAPEGAAWPPPPPPAPGASEEVRACFPELALLRQTLQGALQRREAQKAQLEQDHSTRIKKMEAECLESSSRVQYLEAAFQESSSRVEHLEAAFNKHTSRVQDLEADLNQSTSRVRQLEAKATMDATCIADLRATIASLQKTVEEPKLAASALGTYWPALAARPSRKSSPVRQIRLMSPDRTYVARPRGASPVMSATSLPGSRLSTPAKQVGLATRLPPGASLSGESKFDVKNPIFTISQGQAGVALPLLTVRSIQVLSAPAGGEALQPVVLSAQRF